MRAVAADAQALGEALEGANNVMVLAPPLDPADDRACSALLSAVPESRADVLGVTYTQPPDARLEHWRATGGPVDPAKLAFVVAGEDVRSAAAPRAGPGQAGLGRPVVAVTSPGDLTGLGIELGAVFADWADDGNQVVLCFHTLTTFLQYADLRTAYRFLHVLTGRVRRAGGRAHYHLDPTAHDDGTLNTLLALFDAVVEPDRGGRWAVRRRR